jgi:hypothetical protein
MKHAGSGALDALEPMLAELRKLDGPKEKKRGVFYLKSRAFLHFHEDPAGLFCDVRLDPRDDFTRRAVNTQQERGTLLKEVRAALARHA